MSANIIDAIQQVIAFQVSQGVEGGFVVACAPLVIGKHVISQFKKDFCDWISGGFGAAKSVYQYGGAFGFGEIGMNAACRDDVTALRRVNGNLLNVVGVLKRRHIKRNTLQITFIIFDGLLPCCQLCGAFENSQTRKDADAYESDKNHCDKRDDENF